MAKAKAVDPAKERKKLLITAIKKTINKNSVLPILEDIYLTGKDAILSDLENSLVIPFATPKAKGVCVPAYNLIDCLEMMDSPEIISSKNFGVEVSEGKRSVKLTGDNPENFPLVPMFNSDAELRRGQPYAAIGKVGAAEMEMLADALSFVSGDDLRPAMTGVFFEKKGVQASKTAWMVATDAHRLFWKPISDLTESFILPPKAAKILLALGGEWDLTSNSYLEMKDGKVVYKQPMKNEMVTPIHFFIGDIAYEGTREDAEKKYEDYSANVKWADFEEWCDDMVDRIDPEEKELKSVPDTEQKPEPVFVNAAHVCFERKDGVKLITRVIDGNFPQYRAVIPEGEGHVIATVEKEEMLKELKNAGKFANKSTNMVTLGMNGSFTISSQDVDFGFEYKNDIDGEFEIKDTLPKQYEFGGKLATIKKDLGGVVKISCDYEEKDVMKSDLTELPPSLYIGFNAKFLSEIVNKIPKGTPVRMKMWAPTKAAIINDSYLVMPLMLNQ